MTAFDPPKNVHIDPFRAMAVLDAAQARERAGLATYHFEVGQPGSLAPPSARAAVAQALAQDRMGYSASLGRPELREALAQYYETRYGVTVDPGQIVVTTGASGGIQLSLLACFDKGARIGLTAPGYPAYRNMIQGLGFQPVLIEVGGLWSAGWPYHRQPQQSDRHHAVAKRVRGDLSVERDQRRSTAERRDLSWTYLGAAREHSCGPTRQPRNRAEQL